MSGSGVSNNDFRYDYDSDNDVPQKKYPTEDYLSLGNDNGLHANHQKRVFSRHENEERT